MELNLLTSLLGGSTSSEQFYAGTNELFGVDGIETSTQVGEFFAPVPGGTGVLACKIGGRASGQLALALARLGLGAAGKESRSALGQASQAAFRAAEDPASIFVKNIHLASSSGTKAKFVSDDISEIQGWIARGLQSSAVKFLPNQLDDTFRAIVPGGGPIGTKGQEFIRVIVTGDGRVINAFPVHVR